jgi:hypothetical protein
MNFGLLRQDTSVSQQVNIPPKQQKSRPELVFLYGLKADVRGIGLLQMGQENEGLSTTPLRKGGLSISTR